MAVGGERPGEETEGGRAWCEDWVSPDHSAPARATDATFWLVHIGTYSFPPHPLLTPTYPWVHTVQSKAIHIHWFSQDHRRGKLCRDLCPLYRWGDRGPEREGAWFPDRCMMLVLGVRPQPPASSHWTSHGSPHPAPTKRDAAFGGHRRGGRFTELRAQPWALRLKPPMAVDSVCTGD